MFETVAKRDSNPGSLDCESGILPLSYGAPLYPVSISLCHISLSPHVSQRPQLPPYVFLLRNYVLICCSLKKTPHIQLIIFEPVCSTFLSGDRPCVAHNNEWLLLCAPGSSSLDVRTMAITFDFFHAFLPLAAIAASAPPSGCVDSRNVSYHLHRWVCY